MIKTTTTLVLLFIFQLSFGQVVLKDFGNGLVISLDENFGLDIDEDGVVDLNVNSLEGELGFDPIPDKGCVSTSSLWEPNSTGSLSLRIFEEGELIQWATNEYNWSEDDETSAYTSLDGFVDEWQDSQYGYVGFMLLNGNKTSCGWIKVRIGEERQKLTIKELAYQDDFHSASSAGIYAGTETAVGDIVSVLNLNYDKVTISVFPNPASETVSVNFNLPSSNEIDVEILNQLGKVVYAEHFSENRDKGRLNFDISQLVAGTYFLKLSSNDGYQVKQLQVK